MVAVAEWCAGDGAGDGIDGLDTTFALVDAAGAVGVGV